MSVLNKLKQIKKYCGEHEDCMNCIYYIPINDCEICHVVHSLYFEKAPREWNLKKVEDILNGSD